MERHALAGRGYGVYGASARVIGAIASMVSAALDLGGRAMMSMVSRPGWSGLWCLWCPLVRTWVARAMVFAALDLGGRGCGVYGVSARVVRAMVSAGYRVQAI